MLLIPGPVDVPDSVLRSSAYVVNHRSTEFREIVGDCEKMMNGFAKSSKTVMTTGSGTTAVESMIFSLTEPGENVLAVSFGEFGERMIESLERRGLRVHTIRKGQNDSMSGEEIEQKLSEHGEIKSLFLVQNETGNGTSIRNLKQIARMAKTHGVRVFVDSVSAFGAVPVMVDDWGIDAMATCSQKGLASVPGLGIVCLGREISGNLSPRSDIPQYLDLGISLRFMQKNETPYTPSTGSFNALRTALKILDHEGIENRWKRHSTNAAFLRDFLSKSGADIIGNNGNYSDTVIAFNPHSDVNSIIEGLSSRGIVVSRGMGELNRNALRIGNLGMVSGREIMTFLNAYFDITGKHMRVETADIPEGSLYPENLTD